MPNEPVTRQQPSTRFDCPGRCAGYIAVRAEADATTPDCDVACRGCSRPLQGHDGADVLKYVLVERPPRRQSRCISEGMRVIARASFQASSLLSRLIDICRCG